MLQTSALDASDPTRVHKSSAAALDPEIKSANRTCAEKDEEHKQLFGHSSGSRPISGVSTLWANALDAAGAIAATGSSAAALNIETKSASPTRAHKFCRERIAFW
ncbi:unnamed protein product [Prorocentrum cordatum]|uniref:Uncharacterized protein n=1 Tax=Prorocentrum cordatum TaxID=2364126 RepID=A0ABN9VLX9_9DINO|nr:unnamed protein product [Polarella glacialis]